MAIDGKTVRGAARDGDGCGSLHLVNAWVQENSIALGQYATDVKSNEITAIPELLKLLSLKGAIVSMDAMGCQTKIAQAVRERGANYLFGLKGNQPSLQKEVLESFDDDTCRDLMASDDAFHESADKGQVRRELRRTWVLRDVDWLKKSDNWVDLKTLVLVESTRTLNGATTTERRAYISSLDASAERMAELTRARWSVQNSLHWVLDVTFGEDHTRVSKRNGAENLALIRKMALNLLKQAVVPEVATSIAMRQRLAQFRPEYLGEVLAAGITQD